GSVAGLHAAWKRYGSLPWATLLAPAIRLARGHVIDADRSRNIAGDRELLARFPASRTQFLPGDSAPPPGTTWKQPDLARTLQLISDSGPDVFYRGQIADLIVAEMHRGGGLITKEDLGRYQAKWRTPSWTRREPRRPSPRRSTPGPGAASPSRVADSSWPIAWPASARRPASRTRRAPCRARPPAPSPASGRSRRWRRPSSWTRVA